MLIGIEIGFGYYALILIYALFSLDELRNWHRLSGVERMTVQLYARSVAVMI